MCFADDAFFIKAWGNVRGVYSDGSVSPVSFVAERKVSRSSRETRGSSAEHLPTAPGSGEERPKDSREGVNKK